MSGVQRYDMVSHEGEPVGDPEPVDGGRYVLASDYDAALALLRKCRPALIAPGPAVVRVDLCDRIDALTAPKE